MGAGKGKVGVAGGGKPPSSMGGVGGSSQSSGSMKGFPRSDTVNSLAREYEKSTGQKLSSGNSIYSWPFGSERLSQLFPGRDVKEIHEKLIPYVYKKYGEKGIKRMLAQAYDEGMSSYGISSAKSKYGSSKKDNYQLKDLAVYQWTKGQVEGSNGKWGYWGCSHIRDVEVMVKNKIKIDKSNGYQIMSKVYGDVLNDYIKKNKTNFAMTIYRGFDNKIPSWKPKVGDKWDSLGMASFTTKKYVATSFSGGGGGDNSLKSHGRYVMVLNKSTKGVDISGKSEYGKGEAEVLMPHHSYNITKVEVQGSTTFVYIEE